MSEQLYYTYSTIGSGSTTGERIRAQSPGVGSVNSERVRALMRYLFYKLPVGADLRTSVEAAPISLVLAKTEYDRILSHRKHAGRDGVGRPGNFFTHATINPAVVSPQTGTVEPISAYDAISLWRSPFWKTSEEQAPRKSMMIQSLSPEEIQQHVNMTWQGKLSEVSLQEPHPHCPNQRQTAADWLLQVFSAFLMLKKLNKKHLYIAAPAEMVATFIWCITRCLPRTLTIVQELTFSTYESDIARVPVIIAGTCWLPPTNQTGSFVPQSDLPAASYRPQPGNPILAINCYTQRYTSFEIDEQVSKFVQFATQALLQKHLKELDIILAQAENKGYQDVNKFLTLFRIQQEEPTKQMLQDILTNAQLWSNLQYTNIQDKLIDLIHDTQDTNWQNWWQNQGREYLQRMYLWSRQQPQSEEATALSILADRVMSELHRDLTLDKQESNQRATYWDQLLKSFSSPSTDLALWSRLPGFLAKLPYNNTYQSWWQQSGKQTVQELYQIASKKSQLKEIPQLTEALRNWFQQCTQQMTQAWTKQQDTELSFWLDILQTILPPTRGSQDWNLLLNNLNKALPPGKLPFPWCTWATYKTLLLIWYMVLTLQQYLPEGWLILSWETLPRLLELSELHEVWHKFALEQRILLSQAPISVETLSHIAKCSPLIHKVLAELIQNDNKREKAVTFCESLLQQDYAHRDALLTSILPALVPYQDLTIRIATAAKLAGEQLNQYVGNALYNVLTSQQDVPTWLLSQLESYLTKFRIQTIIPDHQQSTQEERKKTRTILNALIKRNQTLPEPLRPYVSCWYTLCEFFYQPDFLFGKLRVIKRQIKAIALSEALQKELKQEMIAFLSTHIETESDLARVIDALDETLRQSPDTTLPAHALLLKEIARLYGKQTKYHSLQKTIVYIKVVIGETISLTHLKVEPTKREQFVYECLDNLLASLDKNQIKGTETTQWSPTITRLWESYLSRHLSRTTITTSTSTTPASTTSSQSRPASSSSQQPIILDPFQTKELPRITDPSQAKQPSPLTPDKPKGVFGNISSRLKPDNRKDHEKALQALLAALDSKQVDKIAEAYNEKLDPWLTVQQIGYASLAHKFVQVHKQAKTTWNYQEFINMYNMYCNDFILSNDINTTVERIREANEKYKRK